ncbi:TPA: hypothetical protein I7693_11205 [Vibrio vulnificus]|nr:hypothetical protein [Vibrio vulnificus]HAS8246347.1 hypothetical protein [Vibrio vulnificus]
MTKLKMTTVSYRLVFFFERELNRPDKTFWNLGNCISEFDDMPTVQPLPQGVMIDGYPSIIFRSQNGMFACEIGNFRFDLIVAVGPRFGTLKSEALFEEFRDLSMKVFKYIKQNLAIRIKRIGIVSEVFIDPLTNNVVNDIARITSFEVNKELRELNIRMNRVNSAEGTELNDIIAFEVGRVNINGQPITGIKVAKDVNTIDAENIVIDYDSLGVLVPHLTNLVSPTSILEDIICLTPQA